MLVTHADHGKYHNTKAFHEAGYDSLLTATVMLRLSAKVDVERQEKLVVGTETDTDVSFKDALEEQGGVSLINDEDKILEPVTLPPIADLSISVAPSDLDTPLKGTKDLKEEKLEKPDGKKKKKSRSKKKKIKSTVNEKAPDGKFASSNLFDSLQELPLNPETEGDWEAVEQPEIHPNGGSAWQDEPYLQDKTGWVPIETMKREPMELMPGFDSEFWQEFGNKLRIFGTQELVLKIADWPGSSTK